MMASGSLRWQLVTWYLIVAAIVVLLVSALGALVVFEMLSNQTRAALVMASQRIPQLAETYIKQHRSTIGLQTYLESQVKPLNVIVEEPVLDRATRGAVLSGSYANATFEFGTRPPGPPLGLGPGRMVTQRFVGTDPRVGPGPTVTQRFVGTDPRVEVGSISLIGPKPGQPHFWDAMLMPMIPPVNVAMAGAQIVIFNDPLRMQSIMMRYLAAAALFFAIAMFIAWAGANAVARKTLDPLLKTTRALKRFADGDFTPEPVRTTDRSELGDLARAYNGAVEQITAAFDERSRAEAEMRQFVADAGHQLRTPLTVIMGHLSVFAAKAQSPRDSIVFTSMLAQSRRMKGLIGNLITLARLEHDERANELIDVNSLVRQAVEPFHNAGHLRIALQKGTESPLVRAQAEDLLDAISALIDNALKYAPNGPIDVEVTSLGLRCGITVSDRGPGMNESDIHKAFDRFYRGESGSNIEGTGLGLAIVKKTIERAGGSVDIANRADGGLRVAALLPVHATATFDEWRLREHK